MRQFSLKYFSKITTLLIIPTLFLTSFSNFQIKVNAGAGNILSLIIADSTSTDGTNWSPNKTFSNNNQYEMFNCGSQTFSGSEGNAAQIKGIADYNDSISIKNNLNQDSSKYADQRDCENQNNLANFDKTQTNKNTVFAYQYRFTYNFPVDKKEQESSRFAPHTFFQNGVYDGIVYTFTYYNYWNSAKNSWNGWENPNKSNEFGGWLVYPMRVEMGMPNAASLPSLGSNGNNSQNNEKTYDLNNFELTFGKLTTKGSELYMCGASCSYFFVYNQDLITKFPQGLKEKDLVKISGKMKNIKEMGDKFNEITEITKIEKVENSNLLNSTNISDAKTKYFTGKIGNSPIKMIMNIDMKTPEKTFKETGKVPSLTTAKGFYIYENVSKEKINLSCDFYVAGENFNNCTENIGGNTTGFFNFGGDSEKGFWNKKELQSYEFEKDKNSLKVELNETSKFKLEDFLAKSYNNDQIQKLGYEDRAKWQQKLGWDKECGEFTFYDSKIGKAKFYKEDNYGGVTLYPLGDEKYVVGVLCVLGPYWTSEKYFYYDQKTGEKTEQTFRVLEETWQNQKEIRGSFPTFEPNTKLLTTLHRSSNPNCGDQRYSYQLVNKNFELKKLEKRDCDKSFLEPEEMKLYFDKWKTIAIN